MADDFFAEFDEEVTSKPVAAPERAPQGERQPRRDFGGHGGNRYPDEVFSEKIQAEHRTFFIDVKDGNNGMFIKISEKSRGGKRSTIMMDAEDVAQFITAMQNAEKAILDKS